MTTEHIGAFRLSRKWVVLRWSIREGFYFVGPFPDAESAGKWGSDNEDMDPCWQVE
jgi:hypothetical protein